MDASRINSEETDAEHGSTEHSARLGVLHTGLLRPALSFSLAEGPVISTDHHHLKPAAAAPQPTQPPQSSQQCFLSAPLMEPESLSACPVHETQSPCGLFHGGEVTRIRLSTLSLSPHSK